MCIEKLLLLYYNGGASAAAVVASVVVVVVCIVFVVVIDVAVAVCGFSARDYSTDQWFAVLFSLSAQHSDE